MNRSLWTQTLTKEWCPAWPCPACGKGIVALAPESLAYQETAESMRGKALEDWDPEWTEYVFTAWGKCTHPPCSQRFSIAGTGGVAPELDDRGWHWDEFFRPAACLPMPDMIDVPVKCPERVAKALRSSFAVFWLSPAACANAMRISLEHLMDYVGGPRDEGGEDAQRLHKRIERYAKAEESIGPQLMALKWLGNTGSHSGDVGQQELLDAFEILEHVLAEIVERRSDRVAALARELTEKHGK